MNRKCGKNGKYNTEGKDEKECKGKKQKKNNTGEN